MPPAIDPDKREAILADIQARQKSCRQIARDHGVSHSTVRRVAEQAGVDEPFARVNTENATRARVADMAEQRAIASALFLQRAIETLKAMDEPYKVYAFGGKDNTYNEHERDKPPTADLRNLMVTAATGLDKHLVAHRFDSDDGAERTRSMIGDVMGALLDNYTQRHTPDES